MAAENPPTTSPTLLRLLALPENDEAWTTFIDQYGPMIEDRCRRAGLQQADAEDISAEVRLRLVEAMRTFEYDPAQRFRGYLQRIVENAILTHWRILNRRPGWVGRGSDGNDSIPEPLASMGVEIDQRIRSWVDELQRVVERVRFEVGPENWRAFELTALEGLSGAEAARRLGKSVAAVFMAKSRVRAQLLAEAGSRVVD